jgi:5-bromo-4-chloroindolyl phosphate hydrolysis protein
MTDYILCVAKPNIAGYASAVFVMIIYAFLLALVIICLVRASRYFKSAGKERQLTRIELGKVAEEVHLIREHLKVSHQKNKN